jgi:hypothetical protein
MEWYVFTAPVPAALEYGVVATPALVAALAAAVAPVVLAARQALGLGTTDVERPQLRVLDGGKDELARRAA